MPDFSQRLRSFVIRSGRMSDRKKKALTRSEAHSFFSRKDYKSIKPLVLEIGFGMKGGLFETAQNHPEYHFIGAEVHPPAIAKAVGILEEAQKKEAPLNLSLYHGDVLACLQRLQSEGIKLQRVHIFFPDPWPKKRHHRRRLVNASLLSLLNFVLEEEGILHFATDWAPYAEAVRALLEHDSSFLEVSLQESTLPRPPSKFEQKGKNAGREIVDLIYKKRSAP